MPKDELEIVKQARAAAARATKLIPREAWDAAQRVGEVSDRLRLVPQKLTESIADWIREANQQVSDQLRLIPQRLSVSFVDRVRQANQQWLHSVTRDFIQRAQEAFARIVAALRDTLQTFQHERLVSR